MHSLNPVLFRTMPSMPRSVSLQSFGDYRELESSTSSSTKTAIAPDGTPLEYETLELRIHPPNVEIDNSTWDDRTVMTVDSANRPGTLVEVIQCLTELGLDIKQARISSDGGWFVDEFHVCEHGGGRVEDEVKLNAIKKVLNVQVDRDAVARELPETSTVFEIAARDDPGVLAEVVKMLQQNGCDIKSLAAWTYYSRAALVVCVCERGQAIQDKNKLLRMKQLLYHKVKSEFGEPCIKLFERVSGAIHHERRLHQLLLAEENKAWVKFQNASRSPEAAPMMPPQTSLLKARLSLSRTCSLPIEDMSTFTAAPFPCPAPSPNLAAAVTPHPITIPTTSLLRESSSNGSLSSGGTATGSSSRTAHLELPEIEIRDTPLPYWLVTIKCRDRTKLAFDTVCTLADMSYDVYHAAIDTEDQVATQLFYIRSRNGALSLDEEARERLRYMLIASVQRRFPGGLKVHLLAEDTACVVDLANEFSKRNINIARVKVFTSAEGTSVSMYLLDARGGVPDLQLVAATCERLGGQYLVLQEDSPAASWDRSILQPEPISPDPYGPAPAPPGWGATLGLPTAGQTASWVHVNNVASSASPSGSRPAPIEMARQKLYAARRDSAKRFSFTFSYIDKKWEGG